MKKKMIYELLDYHQCDSIEIINPSDLIELPVYWNYYFSVKFA